jgi:hypothetical protein
MAAPRNAPAANSPMTMAASANRERAMLSFEREEMRKVTPHFQKIETWVVQNSKRERFNQFNYSTSSKAMEETRGYELVKEWLKSIVLPQHPVMISSLRTNSNYIDERLLRQCKKVW